MKIGKIFVAIYFSILFALFSTTARAIPWERLTSGTSTDLNDLFFASATVGYTVGGAPFAIGGPGTILKTINGGDSWVSQTVPTISFPGRAPFQPFVDGIHCSSETSCFAVGSDGAILRTTNGIDWSGISVEGEASGAPGRPWFQDVHIVSVSGPVVVAVGSTGFIFRTTNGVTWSQVDLPASVEAATPNLEAVTFANAAEGWAVGSGYVLHTTDGGASWSAQATSLGGGNLFDVFFSPPTTLFVSGGAGFLHKSINSGVSFSSPQFSPTVGFSDIHMNDLSNGWIVGGSGIIRKTVDGGTSFYGAGGGGEIGLTPEQIEDTTSGTGNILRSIQCIGVVPCFIAGDDGVILRRMGPADLNMIPGGSMACAVGYLHYIEVLRNSGGAAAPFSTKVESLNADGSVYGEPLFYASPGLAAGAVEVVDHVRSGLSTAELYTRFVPPGAGSVTLRFTVDYLNAVEEGPAGEGNNVYTQSTPCAGGGAAPGGGGGGTGAGGGGAGGGGAGGEKKKMELKKKEDWKNKFNLKPSPKIPPKKK